MPKPSTRNSSTKLGSKLHLLTEDSTYQDVHQGLPSILNSVDINNNISPVPSPLSSTLSHSKSTSSLKTRSKQQNKAAQQRKHKNKTDIITPPQSPSPRKSARSPRKLQHELVVEDEDDCDDTDQADLAFDSDPSFNKSRLRSSRKIVHRPNYVEENEAEDEGEDEDEDYAMEIDSDDQTLYSAQPKEIVLINEGQLPDIITKKKRRLPERSVVIPSEWGSAQRRKSSAITSPKSQYQQSAVSVSTSSNVDEDNIKDSVDKTMEVETNEGRVTRSRFKSGANMKADLEPISPIVMGSITPERAKKKFLNESALTPRRKRSGLLERLKESRRERGSDRLEPLVVAPPDQEVTVGTLRKNGQILASVDEESNSSVSLPEVNMAWTEENTANDVSTKIATLNNFSRSPSFRESRDWQQADPADLQQLFETFSFKEMGELAERNMEGETEQRQQNTSQYTTNLNVNGLGSETTASLNSLQAVTPSTSSQDNSNPILELSPSIPNCNYPNVIAPAPTPIISKRKLSTPKNGATNKEDFGVSDSDEEPATTPKRMKTSSVGGLFQSLYALGQGITDFVVGNNA